MLKHSLLAFLQIAYDEIGYTISIDEKNVPGYK